MRILVITQKYDKSDPVLGAFNVWWEKLAEKLDSVCILALEKRSEAPMSNMEVFSMGKESGAGKIGRLFNFYKNLFKVLPGNDAVFVHMIPLYLILAWLPVKIFGNKLVMWYAGVTMNNAVKLAVWLSDKTVTSHQSGLRMKSKKTAIIGHGIDTSLFKISNLKPQISTVTILSVGRITPSKGHDLAIKAAADLINAGYDLKLEIIGGIVQSYHQKYFEYLKRTAKDLNIENKVEFTGAVAYEKMPRHLENAQILVDAVPLGGFDKVILEAMSSGVIPLTSNVYIKDVFLPDFKNYLFFKEGDLKDLTQKLKNILDKKLWADDNLIAGLREIVLKNYSLENFISKIVDILQGLVKK